MTGYNEVTLVGTVVKILSEGERVSRVKMHIARKDNGVEDIVIVAIPNAEYKDDLMGKRLHITGWLGAPEKLCVYANSVLDAKGGDKNEVHFTGTIHSMGRYKVDKDGKPRIDFTVKTEGEEHLRPTIPCRAWNKKAKWIEGKRKVSDTVEITGRIQYRKYPKHHVNGVEMIETYEISVITIQMF